MNWNFSTIQEDLYKKLWSLFSAFFVVVEKMRIFIAFEGSFEPFDVSADETVGAVKLMIQVCTSFLSY